MATLNYQPLDHFVTYLRKKHHLTTLIETGTYEGATTIYAAERFDRVVTIDIRADFQEQTKKRCQGLTNIEFLLGDSRDRFPEAVECLSGPAMIWLDAHAAAPDLFGPKDDWPVLDELEALNASPFKHYILIDDAHCFLPDSPWANTPPITEIQKLATAGGYTLRVAHDVIALIPDEDVAELDELGESSYNPSQARINVSPGGIDVKRRFHNNLLPKISASGTAIRGATGPRVLPDKSIAEIVLTNYGYMIIPRFDTNQSPSLRSGFAMCHDDIITLGSYLDKRQPGAVLLDIGANIGAYTCGLHPHAATVHAFEPQRVLYNMLCGSIALNGWYNVFCHNVAISDVNTMIEIPQFDYTQKCSFGSIEFGPVQTEKLDQQRQYDASKIEFVGVKSIDEYAFPRVDMMKIDVEGFEFSVLRGARKTIDRCHPDIFIEHGKVHGPTLFHQLKGMGYKIRDFGGDFLCTWRD